MALPKEPRQKMINIMYLVLTAILALNVSSEILNAFKTIDEGFKNSNLSSQIHNETVLKSFQDSAIMAKFADKVAIIKETHFKPKTVESTIAEETEDTGEASVEVSAMMETYLSAIRNTSK